MNDLLMYSIKSDNSAKTLLNTDFLRPLWYNKYNQYLLHHLCNAKDYHYGGSPFILAKIFMACALDCSAVTL